jgi:hypothetical protein
MLAGYLAIDCRTFLQVYCLPLGFDIARHGMQVPDFGALMINRLIDGCYHQMSGPATLRELRTWA